MVRHAAAPKDDDDKIEQHGVEVEKNPIPKSATAKGVGSVKESKDDHDPVDGGFREFPPGEDDPDGKTKKVDENDQKSHDDRYIEFPPGPDPVPGGYVEFPPGPSDSTPPPPDPDPMGNHTLWSDEELEAPGVDDIEEAIKAKHRKGNKKG
jgi:hypothetical protein